MLYSCEIQGAHASIWFLRFSSRPRAEVRTQCSPGAGESTAWSPAVFICNCYYLFGFQFRVILPYSSPPLSQVHSVIYMLAMRWMEIGIQWLANVHTLSKTTVLGDNSPCSDLFLVYFEIFQLIWDYFSIAFCTCSTLFCLSLTVVLHD